MTDEKRIIVYATAWCPDCLRARRVLDDLKIQYQFVDIDKDAKAKEYVISVNHGNRSVPTIVFPDGSILVEPSSNILTAKLRDSGLV